MRYGGARLRQGCGAVNRIVVHCTDLESLRPTRTREFESRLLRQTLKVLCDPVGIPSYPYPAVKYLSKTTFIAKIACNRVKPVQFGIDIYSRNVRIKL